jgi:hypothetical protein
MTICIFKLSLGARVAALLLGIHVGLKGGFRGGELRGQVIQFQRSYTSGIKNII